MDVVFAQIADYANLSREGKLNILGLFDTINAASFPTVHPQMHLVIRFELLRHERGKSHAVEIQFEDEDGKKLFSISGQIGIQENAQVAVLPLVHSDQIITINNLLIPREGTYQFVVLIDNNVVKGKEVKLRVVQLPKPTLPQQSGE